MRYQARQPVFSLGLEIRFASVGLPGLSFASRCARRMRRSYRLVVDLAA
jgi:hypothetical protein